MAARVVYALGALALLIGLIGLRQATHDVAHYAIVLPGEIPAVVYEPGEPSFWGAPPREGPPLPVVVLAHGFASSKGTMSSLARRLARSGYAVVAFDFAGHGQNPTGFARGATIDDVDEAVLWARMRPGLDGERVVVAGHAMGAGAVLDYASHEPNVAATVAISGVRPLLGPYPPPNLLMIWASGDPSRLRTAARRVGADVAELERLVLDRTYGDPERGTGVRLTEVSGRDHATILWSGDAAERILDWLRQTVGPGDAPADASVSDGRFGWAMLGLVGTLVLFFALPAALASITPALEIGAPADPLTRLGQLLAALVVAVLALSGTDAAAGRGPFDLIPLMVGRDIAALLGVSGIALLVFGVRSGVVRAEALRDPRTWSTALLLFAFGYVLFATVTQPFVDTWLSSHRVGPALACAALALPFFGATEWMLRGPGRTGVWLPIAGKALTLIVITAAALGGLLSFAIVLGLGGFAVVFGVMELVSYRLSRTSPNPWCAALFQSLWIGWVLGAVFPILPG